MTQQIPPNSDALLLRQVGEVLYGPSWQADLSAQISVSDRSMRRWASGEDTIPPGVWRDIHYVAESKWRTVKYFDEEMVKLLDGVSLQPIPNTRPMPDSWGLFFSMATKLGRPVRCYIHREVLDDRVSYNPMKNVLDYFGEHAEVFYRVARRKFDAGEMDGNLLRITNDDFEIGELPDVRGNWRAPYLEPRPGQP
jgi:hypothetical protein